jgi:tetratricopeptide (TPR) repeat protein
MAAIIVTAMVSRLATSLRQAPATVTALAALALFVVWATDDAGYPVTHWASGGLVIAALLALCVGIVGVRWGELSAPVRLALGCLAAYTALSFLSILWAGVPGDAWEGANRTLLYLLVFALFAGWRQRGATAALLLAVWTLALAGLAAFVALHVDAASRAQLETQLPFGRLVYPTGYANANAALWLMAAWPALLLARSRRLAWPLRGVLAGSAVLLADVALLGQSRGSLYATPVMVVLVFAFIPARLRTFAALAPVAAAIAATAPAVLRVGNHLDDDRVNPATLHSAILAIFLAACAVGLVFAAAAAIEQRHAFSERAVGRSRAALTVCAIAALVALIAGGWVAAGDPAARIHHGWETFKSVRGYGANGSGARLTSGLGSNRYDFYRVALNEFAAHPVAGIGADNFQQQYLRHGRSYETPRYPHSVELRTLAQTGVIGALLALAGLGAALLAAGRAMWRSRLGRVLEADVAAAALAGFAYWAVHGSVDWFWEFAGLGAPAFALLGIGCALDPARAPGEPGRKWPRAGRLALIGAAVVAALAAAASLTLPWLSQLDVQSAARAWPRAPRVAYARLDRAADLNPLSDTPYLVAGSIALRFGDLARAQHYFSRALQRTPDGAYATLELGVIASSSGRRQRALYLLRRAVALDPRNPLSRRVLSLVGAGRRVSVQELNRAIFAESRHF